MAYRCAILDDYQNVALKLADWSKITKDVEIKVFTEAVRRSDADTIRDCKDFDIVVMMRERTRFPRAVIDGLPKLKLLITTGAYNASIDMKACQERGIVVCGTGGFGNPTTGITFGLILELTRRIGWEHARMKAGVPWQVTLGMDIEGKTLGVLGLGKLGARAAGVGKAFGMKVIAWSQNLTPERCKEVGVEYVSKDDLFRNADVVTIHLVARRPHPRPRHRQGTRPDEEDRLPGQHLARADRRREGAARRAEQASRSRAPASTCSTSSRCRSTIPYRKMDNVVITPHLGYVSQQNYERYYPDIVENIRGFLDGKPVRVIAPR